MEEEEVTLEQLFTAKGRITTSLEIAQNQLSIVNQQIQEKLNSTEIPINLAEAPPGAELQGAPLGEDLSADKG